MAGGGPGRKGPGRRPVPGPRDVRPAQVPRRRAAASSSGCRLRWRCRTSWSLRCCCCCPRAWPPKRPRFFRLQLFFSSFGLFLLFLPVLSECSPLPAFPPLFLPLAEWQTRAGKRGRPVYGEGPRKEGKLDENSKQTLFHPLLAISDTLFVTISSLFAVVKCLLFLGGGDQQTFPSALSLSRSLRLTFFSFFLLSSSRHRPSPESRSARPRRGQPLGRPPKSPMGLD